MEIFGNPITGYTTEYYLEIIENQAKEGKKIINNLEENLSKRAKGKIKYNRMYNK